MDMEADATISADDVASASAPTVSSPYELWLHAVILRVTSLDLGAASLEAPVAALLAEPDAKFDKSGKLPLLTMQNLESLYFAHIWSLATKEVPNFLFAAYARAVDIHVNLISKCTTCDRDQRLSSIHELRVLAGRFLVMLFSDPEIILQDVGDIREVITMPLVFSWHRSSNVILDLLMLSAPDPFGYISRGTSAPLECTAVAGERFSACCRDNMPDEQAMLAFAGPLCSLISLSSYQINISSETPDVDCVEYFAILKDLFCFCDGKLATLLPQFFFIAGRDKFTAHPQDIEKLSILGPVLSQSWYGGDLNPRRLEAFAKVVRTADMKAIGTHLTQERGAVKSHTEHMFNLINQCIRQPCFKTAFLQFLATGIYLNRKRPAIRIKKADVGTFGFTQNISILMLMLSSPFASKLHAAVDKIDNMYLCSAECVELIPELTRLRASNQEAEAYFNQANADSASSKSFNFVTQCFFLTLYWFHVGYMRNISEYWEVNKSIDDLMQRSNEIREQIARQQQAVNNHTQLDFFQQMLARIEKPIEVHKVQHFSAECYLLDPQIQNETLMFYCYFSCWLLQLICGKEYAQQCPPLPLAEESVPEILTYLPEFFIEDLLSFIEFLCRFKRLFITHPIDNVLELLIVLLSHSFLIRNPHMRSRIVEVIYQMTFHDELTYIIGNHRVSINYLVPALMRFYVDVEQTGMSNQFYEKFSVRYNISKILQNVWQLASHRQRVIETAETYIFVRLVNMMMSDTRYLLDEGISKMAEIDRLHKLINSPEWANMNQQAQQENRGNLETAERHAKSFMMLATQTLETFKYLSGEIQRPFLTAEIIPRLAGMLDHNITVLTGTQVMNLPVGLPDKFGFNRLKLLADICSIFSNLSPYPEFIAAVGEDDHNYSREILERARETLRTTDLISQDKLEKLGEFMNEVEKYCAESKQEVEDLGEIPDEFLDPIMCTIMENPVILPTSGTTVDRSTIIAYLLGDKRDPFNRKPLDPDDIIPNEELSKKIQEFKASRRARNQPDKVDKADSSSS